MLTGSIDGNHVKMSYFLLKLVIIGSRQSSTPGLHDMPVGIDHCGQAGRILRTA